MIKLCSEKDTLYFNFKYFVINISENMMNCLKICEISSESFV